MDYKIGQYCLKNSDLLMNYVTHGEPTYLGSKAYAVETELKIDTNYYFHAKIKKVKNKKQIFDIYLKNNTKVQKLEINYKIEMNNKDEDEWEEINLSFYAKDNFNYIVFQLRDINTDIDFEPIILYQELSEILNLPPFRDSNKEILKIGVKSNPGTLMIINNEPIRIGKTGVYELKNPNINIEFFNVIGTSEDYQIYIDTYYKRKLEDLLKRMKKSECIFNNPYKKRIYNSFIVDYLYYLKGGEE